MNIFPVAVKVIKSESLRLAFVLFYISLSKILSIVYIYICGIYVNLISNIF